MLEDAQNAVMPCARTLDCMHSDTQCALLGSLVILKCLANLLHATEQIESEIGCIQLVSGKSLTSLSADSLQFYAHHVTLLNVTETARRGHFMNGDTMLLTQRLSFVVLTQARITCFIARQKKVKRNIQTLEALHESIEHSLTPLQNTALKGLSCQTNHEKQPLLFSILASSIADIPESEDLLGIKLGLRTTTPCSFCEARKHECSFYTLSPPKYLLKLKSLVAAFFLLNETFRRQRYAS